MEKLSLLQELEALGETPRNSQQFPSSLIPVLSVRQRQNWDCGLACAAMVLSKFYRPSPSLESLQMLCGVESIWTIDLAYLLRRCFRSKITLCTTYLGLNPAYAEEKFYAKHLEKDEARINSLFKQAESDRISVLKRPVSAAELKFAVSSGRYLVVALIDKGKLAEQSNDGSVGYIGHFILIHGYDSATDSYYIKDPAMLDVESGGGSSFAIREEQQQQKVSAEQLEVARLAHGTDEDLLFIELPSNIVARHSHY